MIKTAVLVFFASLSLAACTQYATPQTTGNQTVLPTTVQNQIKYDISIQNLTFSPKTVEVTAGQTITIINNDTVPHTITSDDSSSFTTSAINPGDSASLAAPAPGTYPFHCNLHKSMTATMVVK